MQQPLKSYKEVMRATAVLLAAVACVPSIARAQLPGGLSLLPGLGTLMGGQTLVIPPTLAGPGLPVFDQAVTQNSAATAISLTTTTVGGWYTPQASLLSNINQTLFSGVNPQNAAELMPVTQGLPCDSYTPMTTQIAPALMNTYESAISETQQLTSELQSENFTTIAANVQAPAALAATQGVGQAVMTLVQEMQLMRAQLAALTMVIATDDLHQLDTTVRAEMPRQGGGC